MTATATNRVRRTATAAAAGLAVTAGLLVGAPPALAASPGTVWTVGLGSDGQLGSGSTGNRAAFAAVAGLSQVVEVAGGREHVLARTSSGQVYAWGDDSKGAVGDGGSATDRTTPVLVLSNATQIATGHYHSLAVTNGTVQSWGYNNYGQLGNGTLTNRTSPGPVTGLSGVAGVTGGRDMSFALLTTGAVRAWGNNVNGELGDGTTAQRTTPVAVVGITDAVALAGGRNHGLALLPDGTIKAWGLNNYGQLGDGSVTNRPTPVTVQGITNAVAIGAGAEHSIAVLADGRVMTWGRGQRGQLGSGAIVARRTTPGVVNGLPAIVSVDAGRDHTMAITADGRLFTWGFDDYGQVGDGGTANRLSPYQVPGITNAVEAGGGRGYTVLIRSDGVTPPPDTTPPDVPGTPTATSTVSGRVDLTWAASHDETATSITYRVYRDGGGTAIATLNSSSTGSITWSDTGRTPGAVHTYQVDASDGTNVSARSAASAEVTVADGGGNVILTDGFGTFPTGFSSATGLVSDASRFAPADSAPSIRAQPSNSTAFAYKDLPTSETRVCAQVAVRVEANSGTLALLKLRAGSASVGRVSISATRGLSVRADVVGTTFTTSATLPLNAWSTVQLCVTTGAAGSIQLSQNGSTVGTWSTSTGTAPITRVQLGDNDPRTAIYNLDALSVTR